MESNNSYIPCLPDCNCEICNRVRSLEYIDNKNNVDNNVSYNYDMYTENMY